MSAPLQFEKPTAMRIIANSKDSLTIRTGVGSWWLGLAGLILLATALVSGLAQFAYALWTAQFIGALITLVVTVLAVAFAALFAVAITHQRLCVSQSQVEITRRLFALPLRQKSARFDTIDAVEVIEDSSDDSVAAWLELRSGKQSVRFGDGYEPANLNRLRDEINRRRKR